MFTTFILCSLAWAYGAFSIVFAFREVSPALRPVFPLRLPLLVGLLFVFLPEHHHVKAARISIGSLFLLCAVVGMGRALYQFIAYGWT